MARLEKLPSGAEVMCSGCKTIDELECSEPFDRNIYGIAEYLITESVIGVDIESDYIYLKF